MARFAIFSDVHGNLAALRAVLEEIQRLSVDQAYCLGDLVGYGPEPNGVIELIRARGIPTILGNYDDGVAFERGDCGCYYGTPEARRIGDASYAFTASAVTEENKAWLRTLPRELELEVGRHSLHLVHGSPRRINEYLQPTRDERSFRRIAAAEQADILLFGHTHAAWDRSWGKVHFINVGSAGRPKDGDPRAMFTLLTLEEKKLPKVGVARVDYEVDQTVQGVLAAGLPRELAEAFKRGT